MIEHCRLNKIAFIQPVTGGALAAANQRGAIFTSDVQIVEHCLELILVDARPNFSVRIHAIAESQRFCALRNSLDELIGDLIYNHRAAGSRATLT